MAAPATAGPHADLRLGGGANDVFFSGSYGTILHYDGTEFTFMDSGTDGTVSGLWGVSSTDVFAVGYDFAGAVILHYDGVAWTPMSHSETASLKSVFGFSSVDVFAVGSGGVIVHYDGVSWTSMVSGSSAQLQKVWGNAPNDVFAVGSEGTILHYDGIAWGPPGGGGLFDMWGSDADNIIGAGYRSILRWDGATWNLEWSHPRINIFLYGVWGSSVNDIYVVGTEGTIVHFDGSAWSVMTSFYTWDLESVWGTEASDVFAVGEYGTVLHYDGSTWKPMTSATTSRLSDVWGLSGSDVFAVGVDGKIFHFDGLS